MHMLMDACSGLCSGNLEVNLILSLLFCLDSWGRWKEDSRASDVPDFQCVYPVPLCPPTKQSSSHTLLNLIAAGFFSHSQGSALPKESKVSGVSKVESGPRPYPRPAHLALTQPPA